MEDRVRFFLLLLLFAENLRLAAANLEGRETESGGGGEEVRLPREWKEVKLPLFLSLHASFPPPPSFGIKTDRLDVTQT